MVLKEVILLFTLCGVLKCKTEDFTIPDVTLEAYEPKGFRASIPALSGIQMFAFHGNLNKEIAQVDPGEFNGNSIQPADNNMWSYVNNDISLKVGDTIYYWTFIQYEKLGYRKDAQKWVVQELLKSDDKNCQSSISLVTKKAFVCKDSTILEENFNGPEIDRSKWIIEEYIPAISEDFEFVSYQNKADVCYIHNGRLFIKPKAAENEDDVRGELDLRNSCTRPSHAECYTRHETAFILPPVTSAKIVSVTSFRYGKVEIKAKLPAGDWIYPQIYLEQVSEHSKKLWIAYSRGNTHLRASNGEDIGGQLLFGGPILQSREPHRSTYLRSKKNSIPFSSQTHTYTVIWNKDSITLLLDGNEYGKINQEEMRQISFAQNDMVRLVLGVGVGGINDFPDDFSTGDSDVKKPWKNRERLQVKNFFHARDKWVKTWSGDQTALQVEYIKITAL